MDSLRLLKRLDQPVEKNSVEAAIAETDAVLVMLVERVHGRLPLIRSRYDTRSPSHLVEPQGEGYQGQSPWLVRSGKSGQIEEARGSNGIIPEAGPHAPLSAR